MSTMYLMFSHSLTTNQIQNAQEDLGVTAFIEMPEELKVQWGNVPPEPTSIREFAQPFVTWLCDHLKGSGKTIITIAEKKYCWESILENSGISDEGNSDYVLIQGDYGLTVYMVKQCWNLGFFPVYSTTRRDVKETRLPDGTVQTNRTFRHIRFRTYE